MRDITEHKRSEEALRNSEEKYRESEEKYRNITDQLLMGIFILQDNIFKYVNEAVSTINEFTVEEMMVWTPLEFLERIHPDDRPEIYKLSSHRQDGLNDVPKSVSCRVITKSGKIKWVEAYGSSIIFQGKPADMSMVIDVTEKKEAEQKIKESEEKYREAFNRAEFYKDIFAHDINNILQSILTTTELSSLLIKNGENIVDLKNLFNDLKIQVDRGAKLVSNVQTLSKIENTAAPLIKVKVNQILNNAIKFISDSYQQDVDIFVESQQDEYLIHANELLVEVFENILINAIRHINNNNIEISVHLSRYEENNRQNIKIEFIDNGKGVEDSRKEIIFQRGYEKSKSTSGMGLGLSLVKKILQNYKGQIWVEDRVEGDYSKGSNFIVLIPEAE